ncbi:MAG: hypothetical protein AAF517_12720 [Planctomycetota bacterium]
MTRKEPAKGLRVRQTLPNYDSKSVHHSIYLPQNWTAGRKYPVLFEYSGNGPYRNSYGDESRGVVEGSCLGYGISGGRDFIWVVLPFLSGDGTRNVKQWWGDKPKYDPKPTVTYCKKAVPWICEKYGGDRDAVFLVGFSRGAIACNYIGLHDDEIASLWRGFVVYSHYDGVVRWGYPGSDRESALTRLRRLRGRPQFVCHESGASPSSSLNATRRYLKASGLDASMTFVETGFRNHNDAWTLRPSQARKRLRGWLRDVLKKPTKPGIQRD